MDLRFAILSGHVLVAGDFNRDRISERDFFELAVVNREVLEVLDQSLAHNGTAKDRML